MDLIKGALIGQIPLLDMPARCQHLLDSPAGAALPLTMMKNANAYGRSSKVFADSSEVYAMCMLSQ